MDATTRRGKPAIELLTLRRATDVFLTLLRDVDHWAEEVAETNRTTEPTFAGLLDQLRDEVQVALNHREQGTSARIAHVLAELLGEV